MSGDPRPAAPVRPADRVLLWLAEGGGSGRVRVAPGTFGSLVGLGWCVVLLLPGSPALYVAGTVVAAALAVPVCGAAERILGRTDPGSVVLDEIVALPVAFLGYVWHWWRGAGELPPADEIAHWWPALAATFVLFRVFDIWKPWPIRRLQHLPGGWGVVVDDLLAGVVSAVLLAAGTHAWFWFRLVRG